MSLQVQRQPDDDPARRADFVAAMAKKEVRKQAHKSDLQQLEELLQRMMRELLEGEIKPKVGDVLKALEMKLKLKLPEDEKSKIWELINQLRREELSSEDASAKKRSKTQSKKQSKQRSKKDRKSGNGKEASS